MARRFVALDRDGTIIVERHYLSDPQGVELLPGAAAGLRRLRDLGCGLVVVTNQSAIGRGLLDEAQLGLIHRRLHDLLQAKGVVVDRLFHCPHLPGDNCRCRKPQPAMLERAGQDLGFDPGASFVVGDKVCDLELGRRVGATTFLVCTGYGSQAAAQGTSRADYVVDCVQDAAQVIEHLLCDLVERHLFGEQRPEDAGLA